MKEFIIFLIAAVIVVFCFVKLGQAFKYSNDWVELEHEHYAYVRSGILIAEVWPELVEDTVTVWHWIVYLKTSFNQPYSGTETDIEKAFDKARSIMFGGYWM